MDLEGALLEGELQEERQALKQEEERLLELKERLLQTELKCREEREKVSWCSLEVFLIVSPTILLLQFQFRTSGCLKQIIACPLPVP